MSISPKRLDYFRKDEKMATREYAEAADNVFSEAARELFLAMSRDEARHAEMLDKIRKFEEDAKRPKKSKLNVFNRDKDADYEEKVKEYLETVEPSTEIAGHDEYED